MELSTGNLVEDLARWQKSYIANCKAKEMSARTISIYSGILDELTEFSRPHQDQATIKDLNQFFISTFFNEKAKKQEKMKKQNPKGRFGFGSSTKSLYSAVIKKFLLYISENNHDSVDLTRPMQEFKVKREKKLKPRLEETEITTILNSAEKLKDSGKRSLTTYRNVLLFKIFLYTGMRAEEMVQLRFSDLVFRTQTEDKITEGEGGEKKVQHITHELYMIKVEGKGNKERLVYLPKSAIEDELDFLLESRQSSDFIAFSTRSGEAINTKKVYELLDRLYRAAGVSKRGVHLLRHTLARRLVDRDVNLETIRDILGHSSIGITSEFYAKTNEKNKQKALITE
ncbi:tyrosine-type recombinase/integrase [Geomonas subterranea]|uniref:tyrosine-type recombinase/integrase n=1 Tax=Geomonas subterranea TaxID=2847989 RepID=UPI001CD40014|nr:site-specific integrase [Geomonas fuzhouensis]